MERSHVANLNRIAKYLHVTPGKIDINKEKMVCRSVKTKLIGFSTIVSAMARESKSNQFSSLDLVTQCLIVQWFDYAVLFVSPASDSKSSIELVLQDLNDYLLHRSYLVGQRLTLADVVVFYSVSDIMARKPNLPSNLSQQQHSTLAPIVIISLQVTLTPAAKEKYLNVSRWYEHLQNIDEIRQNVPFVNLSSIFLHS